MKLFYTTDLHGSERTFQKLLEAIRTRTEIDVFILGGDHAGKGFYPKQPIEGGWCIHGPQQASVINSPEKLAIAEERAAFHGAYLVDLPPDESLNITAPYIVPAAAKHQAIIARAKDWAARLSQAAQESGKKIVITFGNTDPYTLDLVYQKPGLLVATNSAVDLPNDWKLISVAEVPVKNKSKTERGATEDEIRSRIRKLSGEAHGVNKTIWAIHCPPITTPIATRKKDKGVFGSYGVFSKISKKGPPLSLHGHIHQPQKRQCRIGRTLCLNPGSRLGRLDAAIITLEGGRVQRAQIEIERMGTNPLPLALANIARIKQAARGA